MNPGITVEELEKVKTNLCKVICMLKDIDNKPKHIKSLRRESESFEIPKEKPSLSSLLLKLGIANIDLVKSGPFVTIDFLIREPNDILKLNIVDPSTLPDWLTQMPQKFE